MKVCEFKVHRLSIYINIAFFLFLFWYFIIHVGADVYYRKYVSPKETFLNDIYYAAKVNAYTALNERLDREQAYTVFIGDSLIEQFPVNELFAGDQVINRGIGMDTTVGVMRRLDNNINNITIASSFLMIGYNDLKYRSVEETGKNIEKIITGIRGKNKYFLGIVPCMDSAYNDKIMQINERMKEAAERMSFTYIDCYHLFAGSDGKIDPRYYYDGIHLNVAGYIKIKELIDPLIVSQ